MGVYSRDLLCTVALRMLLDRRLLLAHGGQVGKLPCYFVSQRLGVTFHVGKLPFVLRRFFAELLASGPPQPGELNALFRKQRSRVALEFSAQVSTVRVLAPRVRRGGADLAEQSSHAVRVRQRPRR